MTDPSPRKRVCPECHGSGISYLDSRGNSDHMNAHLCTKCSGTGKMDR